MLGQILSRSKADETEVSLHVGDECITRFSINRIHENMVEERVSLWVRVRQGNRTGSAATNQTDEQALDHVLSQALAMARSSPEEDQDLGFAREDEICRGSAPQAPLEQIDPLAIGEQVRRICDQAHAAQMHASGNFTVSTSKLGIGTTRGGITMGYYNKSFLNILMQDQQAGTSGWASNAAAQPSAIDSEALAQEAKAKAQVPLAVEGIPPGEYPALLDPYAMEEIISTLAVSAFNADAYHSGASVTSSKMGRRVFSETISLRDDAYDARGCPKLFDADGLQKRVVALVESGVISGVLHDRATAKRYGAQSTGHAQERPALYLPGPQAENLFMQAGDADQEQLLSALQRGVWITRFQYTSVLDPSDLTINGTTRDGTFWVEDGKVKAALPNLSFRFSILSALQNVRRIGADARLLNGLFGVVHVPSTVVDAIHIG